MLFNSYIFLCLFLPITLLAYYLLGRVKPRWGAIWLCATSFVFYGWWNPQFVALLAMSITFNYAVGTTMLALKQRPSLQKATLILGLAVNLTLLVHYKYFVAILGVFEQWGLVAHGAPDSIILPLGISFFTFTQIGYLLDCRAGAVDDNHPLSYVLFVTFFPHLIAGPILHHHEMMPQFTRAESYRFKAENLSIGATLFIIGLAKKVLLADGIAPYADSGFADTSTLQFWGAWGASVCYALQLYFDFSGYSDMALGLAKMFGIRFPLNFNSPYKAANIIEFWARWHMTLTRYLTAYLFYPVAMAVARWRSENGRTTGAAAQKSLSGFLGLIVWPTFFTMALAGIWHGAGVQYLIFGLLHAGYLSVNHAWRLLFATRSSLQARVRGPLGRLICVLITFVAVLVAQAFFRADGVREAMDLLIGMLGLRGVEGLGGFVTGQGPLLSSDTALQLSYVVVLLGIVWCAPNAHQILGSDSPALAKPQAATAPLMRWRPNAVWLTMSMVTLMFCLINLHKESRFLYFQF